MAGLHRFSAFILAGGALTVHLPADAHGPNYTEQFLTAHMVQDANLLKKEKGKEPGQPRQAEEPARKAGAGAAVAGDRDAEIERELQNRAPQNGRDRALDLEIRHRNAQPVKDARVEQAEALVRLEQQLERYASHGRSGLVVEYHLVMPGEDDPLLGPNATYPKGSCVVKGLRLDKPLRQQDLDIHGTQRMRRAVAIHEDAHCRISPYIQSEAGNKSPFQALLGFLSLKPLPTMKEIQVAQEYKNLVTESISDMAAVLITASRDGEKEARATLQELRKHRLEAKGTDHDTVHGLKLVESLLGKYPEIYASPETAFRSAVKIGIRSASATFPNNLKEGEWLLTQKPYFKQHLATVEKGLDRAMHDYEHGPYASAPAVLGASQIQLKPGARRLEVEGNGGTHPMKKSPGAAGPDPVSAGAFARHDHDAMMAELHQRAATQLAQRDQNLVSSIKALLLPGATSSDNKPAVAPGR